MGTSDRNNRRQNDGEIRDQDLLKAFDFETTAEDPYLTVSEVADALATHWDIEVTNEPVRIRLEQMRDGDTISKRDFGSGVAYRSLVGPKLADDIETSIQESKGELEAGRTMSHEQVWVDSSST
jgi:pterin-4a-carbinolamine dehydratase